MKQRVKAIVVVLMAFLVGLSAAYAAPVRLSSLKYDKMQRPTFIAQDSQGNLYVSETALDVVRIFDPQGTYLKSLSVDRPLGLAVDLSGLIYVCSERKNRIQVFNPDLTFARILGDARGDVRSTAIAIDSRGNIYLVDNFNNKMIRHDTVKVYDAGGNYAYSFGATGSTDGFFNQPTGLAINEVLGEIYVADAPVISTAQGMTKGARVQVFDINNNGKWLRTMPVSYGTGVGQITSPVGLSVDQTGNLFVVDSFQRAVLIFNTTTGTSNGALYDMTVPLQLPLGVVIGRDNIAHVTSNGGASVESYGLEGYVTLNAGPATLAFLASQYGMAPAAQNITVSNSGSGTLTWSVSADQLWITGGSISGTTGPNGTTPISIGVNIGGLTPGTYTGTVAITSSTGSKSAIPVTLTVAPAPMLTLSSGWLNFSAKRTKSITPQQLIVEIQNIASLPWSTQIDSGSPWISMTPSSGTTTTTALVTINSASLVSSGTYTGYVTFNAPGALGDGSKLTVNVTILPSTRINVTSNRPDASFSVTGGLASYSGAGTTWNVEDATAGDYVISYNTVTGYRRPLPQTKTLLADSEILFAGTYLSWKNLAASKNIITARGASGTYDSLIKTYKADGSAVAPDFVALSSMFGANIAIGDVDGDGVAEIIVGTGAGSENSTTVRIYKADRKTLLAEFEAFPGMHGGVNVAAADFNADGKAEVIVSLAGGVDNTPGLVKIYAYDGGTNNMVPTGIEFLAHENLSGVNIAAADVDGNFAPRLLTAPVSGTENNPGSIKIWKIDGIKTMGTWTISTPPSEIPLLNTFGATLAGGDADGDGKDEIIAGIGSDTDNPHVRIFRADGTEVNSFPVFKGKYGVNVAAADLYGDGIVEIIAGIGADLGGQTSTQPYNTDRENRRKTKDKTSGQTKNINETVRIFNSAGQLLNKLTPYPDSRYGVKVSVGDLGL